MHIFPLALRSFLHFGLLVQLNEHLDCRTCIFCLPIQFPILGRWDSWAWKISTIIRQNIHYDAIIFFRSKVVLIADLFRHWSNIEHVAFELPHCSLSNYTLDSVIVHSFEFSIFLLLFIANHEQPKLTWLSIKLA